MLREVAQRIPLMHRDELRRFEADVAKFGLYWAIVVEQGENYPPDQAERERTCLEVERALALKKRVACRPCPRSWTIEPPAKSPPQGPDVSAVRRFASKIRARGDCWEWPGRPRHELEAYRAFRMDGRTVAAHRFAYMVAKGLIPPDHEVHHICYHPWCVRPSHLIAVSVSEHQRVHAEHWRRMQEQWRRERSRAPLSMDAPVQGSPGRGGLDVRELQGRTTGEIR